MHVLMHFRGGSHRTAPADDLIAISRAHAMQRCCDDLPTCTFVDNHCGPSSSSPVIYLPLWPFTASVTTSASRDVLLSRRQCTPLSGNQHEHHVNQPAAVAAWLGLMLAQYWSSAASSTITNIVTPRLFSSRLCVNTPAQER